MHHAEHGGVMTYQGGGRQARIPLVRLARVRSAYSTKGAWKVRRAHATRMHLHFTATLRHMAATATCTFHCPSLARAAPALPRTFVWPDQVGVNRSGHQSEGHRRPCKGSPALPYSTPSSNLAADCRSRRSPRGFPNPQCLPHATL